VIKEEIRGAKLLREMGQGMLPEVWGGEMNLANNKRGQGEAL